MTRLGQSGPGCYCKRRETLLEGNGTIPIDFDLQSLLADWLFDHIDLAAEDGGDPSFEFIQPAKIIEATFGKIFG
jgi:hypothetical protein